MEQFVQDGSALSAVRQVVSGAKFRGVRFDPWSNGSTSHLHILNDRDEIIGEADDYLHPIYGWSVRLFDGSYTGNVDRDQIEIVE